MQRFARPMAPILTPRAAAAMLPWQRPHPTARDSLPGGLPKIGVAGHETLPNWHPISSALTPSRPGLQCVATGVFPHGRHRHRLCHIRWQAVSCGSPDGSLARRTDTSRELPYSFLTTFVDTNQLRTEPLAEGKSVLRLHTAAGQTRLRRLVNTRCSQPTYGVANTNVLTLPCAHATSRIGADVRAPWLRRRDM